MADATYQPKVYRQQGGERFVVASTGSLDIESGGELDIESGGVLKISGTNFISSGGKVDLSSGVAWLSSGIFTTGTVIAAAVTSTGTGTFNAVTSTGAGTFNAVTSTGTGTFNAVTSTGTGTFNAVTSTGTGTFNAVTSTGTGTFNAVTSTGTGTFNAVSISTSGSYASLLGGVKEYVEATTGGALASYGLSVVTSTGDARGYTIVPVANAVKYIACSNATTGLITVTTTGTYDGTNTILTFSTGSVDRPGGVMLVGASTSRWYLMTPVSTAEFALSTA